MPRKEDLLQKLCRKPIPKNFTKSELDMLMKKCGCEKYSGGRGSSIAYFHIEKKESCSLMNRIQEKNCIYISNKDDDSVPERSW